MKAKQKNEYQEAFLIFKLFLIFVIIKRNFSIKKMIEKNNDEEWKAKKRAFYEEKIKEVIEDLKQIKGGTFLSFLEEYSDCNQSGVDYNGVYGLCYVIFSSKLRGNIISLTDGMAKINFWHKERLSITSDGEIVISDGVIVDKEFLLFLNSVYDTATPTEEMFEKNNFEL